MAKRTVCDVCNCDMSGFLDTYKVTASKKIYSGSAYNPDIDVCSPECLMELAFRRMKLQNSTIRDMSFFEYVQYVYLSQTKASRD